MDRISNQRVQVGFTLIEVSIAMTLLALLAALTYGAFYLGHRAMEKAQARSEESQRLRSAGDLLAGYIRSIHPYRSSPQRAEIFFSGKANHLTFVSALSVGMGGRGMSKVSIGVEGDGAWNLVLEEELPVRFEDNGAASGYKNRVVLRQGIRDLRIDYLYRDPSSGEANWLEEWDGGERRSLPRAVRLSYRRERGDEVQWVFPIMMSVLVP